MKVVFYGVKKEAGFGWEWRITLDWQTDLASMTADMSRGGKRVERILRLEPELSFGQALRCQIILNEMNWGEMTENGLVDKMAGNVKLAEALPEGVRRQLVWRTVRVGAVAGAAVGTAAARAAGGMATQGMAARGMATRGMAINPVELERLVQLLEGRSLLLEELQALLADRGLVEVAEHWKVYVQAAVLTGRLQWMNGVKAPEIGGSGAGTGSAGWRRLLRKPAPAQCRRCGSSRLNYTDCSSCGGLCAYCEDCLTMGRVRSCSLLLCSSVVGAGGRFESGNPAAVPASAPVPSVEELCRQWGLSSAQAAASHEGLVFLSASVGDKMGLSEPACFLIWAVTGAGKTEMIFPLIDYELGRGGSVCIATPRRDVVLELSPRLGKAFPKVEIVTLYGGSEQRWKQGRLTIATTHQLLRFRHKFDLIVIDELDAFPFHNNAMLEYAAREACKLDGRYIFLSATPPKHLQQAVARKKLPCAKVPARFHRHPLPVPELIRVHPLKQWLAKGSIPVHLQRRVQKSLDRGAQLFVFVSAIRWIESAVALFRAAHPGIAIEGTSSKDPLRSDKVLQFRNGEIRLLLTTTILERGVTVPKTDVFILDADSELFDEASLVQMSGRAGRSKDDPRGRVVFAAPDKTVAQLLAVRQIKRMNALAKSQGYLVDG
jgi:late competence protein required for DNA uptake (superfamily II DNA/RNA helicase)